MKDKILQPNPNQSRLASAGREYPDEPRVAVGAVVFNNDRVLLVKRGKAPSHDLWAIPGGRVALGETLAQAAEREIFEETGLRVRVGSPVYTFEHIERDADGSVRFHYVIVDLLAEYTGGDIRAGDDARDVRWISAAELVQLNVSPSTLALLQNHFAFGRREEKRY